MHTLLGLFLQEIAAVEALAALEPTPRLYAALVIARRFALVEVGEHVHQLLPLAAVVAIVLRENIRAQSSRIVVVHKVAETRAGLHHVLQVLLLHLVDLPLELIVLDVALVQLGELLLQLIDLLLTFEARLLLRFALRGDVVQGD